MMVNKRPIMREFVSRLFIYCYRDEEEIDWFIYTRENNIHLEINTSARGGEKSIIENFICSPYQIILSFSTPSSESNYKTLLSILLRLSSPNKLASLKFSPKKGKEKKKCQKKPVYDSSPRFFNVDRSDSIRNRMVAPIVLVRTCQA